MSTSLEPALYSSMNELVRFSGEAVLIANSLILIGLTFRTFSDAVSESVRPLVECVQDALATRSPLNAADPDVMLKVARTVAPGATASLKVFELSADPETAAFH